MCIHNDPEFETFTDGDPTVPKRGLRNLAKGDLLVFYAGLEGWDFHCDPALTSLDTPRLTVRLQHGNTLGRNSELSLEKTFTSVTVLFSTTRKTDLF